MGIEIFFDKEGASEYVGADFEIVFRQFLNIVISGRGKSTAEIVCFFIVTLF